MSVETGSVQEPKIYCRDIFKIAWKREERGGKKAVFSKNKMEMWGEGGVFLDVSYAKSACVWNTDTSR